MAKKISRIEAKFAELKARGEKALIPFVTAGDPSLRATKEIVLEMERAGADLIELGIPFSDPMADGPTIQASSDRALKAGTTPRDVIKLVADIRKKSEIPIVLFGYYNPVFVYGPAKFARDAARAGVDGVLVVDLPPEESEELGRELRKNNLDAVFTLTPTSDSERIKKVVKVASGFLYYVSVTGVTGARSSVGTKIKGSVAKVRRHSKLPIGVGFGISTPAQVKDVCSYADGVIVGSAIVNIIKKHGASKDLAKRVGAFVRSLKKGTLSKA